MTNVKINKNVEIMDSTLRDGEQTPGVAFTPAEKLQIVRYAVNQLRVDRMEIGSCRVSEGEFSGVAAVLEWAAAKGCLPSMEILGFLDGGKSAGWIKAAGGKTVNLLGKGSEIHCRGQLRLTPDKHTLLVQKEIENAVNMGLSVNLYLEDWARGMRSSLGYVLGLIDKVKDMPVQRIMLADTLGVLHPEELAEYIRWLRDAFGDIHFDFHGHNDYGMVTALSLAAVRAGISGVHTTINGLGERAGNQPLAQFVAAVNDMTDRHVRVSEKHLYAASNLVQALSGKRYAWNAPVVGSDVFTQTCGVHADGDKKGGLYVNQLLPERFGRSRDYALGKLSGKASLDKNLEAIGSELDQNERQKVLQEIIRLGDRKKHVTAADLPFVIGAVLRAPVDEIFRITSYRIVTVHNALPEAELTLTGPGGEITTASSGDGGFDAFFKALRKAARHFRLLLPRLLDYEVRIPPGGKTDAIVETTITWYRREGGNIVTNGVDCDQLAAAVAAVQKMLNMVARDKKYSECAPGEDE